MGDCGMTKMEDWQKLTECLKCHDRIFSRWPGEFVTCRCGAVSVDQSPRLSRYLGDRENFVLIEPQERKGTTT